MKTPSTTYLLAWQENITPATFAQIHTALLSGLLGQIGFRAEENEPYWGARGLRFTIHPMSVLRKAKATSPFILPLKCWQIWIIAFLHRIGP